MELLALLHIIGRYKWMIIVLCLSAVVTAVSLTYVLSEKYESAAVILVRPQEQLTLTPLRSDKEALNFPLTQLVPFEATSRTYGEVIRSRAVVSRIVARLNLHKKSEPVEWWKKLRNDIKGKLLDLWTYAKYGRIPQVDPVVEAEEKVRKSISIEPTKDTYVFEIKYQAADPNVAAAVVNAAADIFVEYYRELYHEESATSRRFLEEQLRDSNLALSEARGELLAFKQKFEIVSLDREVENDIDSLAEFQSNLELLRRDIAGARAEVGSLREQLGLSAAAGDRRRKSETALGEMSAKVRETLMSELALAEARLASLQASKTDLERLVERRTIASKKLPSQQRELARLELNARGAEETYQFIKKAYDEAGIHESAKVQEIRMVSAGSVPAYPVKPIKVHYAVFAFCLALVVGVAMAFLLEYLNFTIRTVEQARKALNVPLLATMPPLKA